MNSKLLVKAIVRGNAAQIKDAFRSALNSKIREKIGERKTEVAKTYFVKEETEKDEEELEEGGEGSGRKGHTTDNQHKDFKPGSTHSAGELYSNGYRYKSVHHGNHVFQHHRTGHVHHFDQVKPGQYKHKYSVGVRPEKK